MEEPIEFTFTEGGSLAFTLPDPEYAGWELAQASRWAVVAEISGHALGMTADQTARLAELLQTTHEPQATEHIPVGPGKDLILRITSGADQVELSVFNADTPTKARLIIPADRCREVYEALTTAPLIS